MHNTYVLWFLVVTFTMLWRLITCIIIINTDSPKH